MTRISFPADISKNFSKKYCTAINIESGEHQNLLWFKAFSRISLIYRFLESKLKFNFMELSKH